MKVLHKITTKVVFFIVTTIIITTLIYGCEYNNQTTKSSFTNTSVATKEPQNENPSIFENTGNDSFLVDGEDMIFYSENPEVGLYIAKKDGSEKNKLVSGYVHDINIMNDRIYYILETKIGNTQSELKDLYSYSLFSINKDGSNKLELIKDCGDVRITDNCIFYKFEIDNIAYRYNNKKIPENQGYLYKYDLETKKSTLLVDEYVGYYQIENDKIYYIPSDFSETEDKPNYDEICYVSAKNSSDKKLIYKSDINNPIDYSFIIDKGNIIAVIGNDICQLNIDSGKINILYKDAEFLSVINHYHLYSNYAIFRVIDEPKKFYKINYTDKKCKCIYEIPTDTKEGNLLKFRDKFFYYNYDIIPYEI